MQRDYQAYTLENSRSLAITPWLAIYERDANPHRHVARLACTRARRKRAVTLNAAAAIIRWPLKTCPFRDSFSGNSAWGVKMPTHNTPYNLFVRTCRVKYTHNVHAWRRDAHLYAEERYTTGEKAKESEYPADLCAIDGLSSLCIAGALITRNYIWKGGS